MRKYQPAQVDWPEIQQRIQAGESFNAVSKDYEVSRQAIQKRCQREGWISDKPLTVAIKRQQRELQVATMQPDATHQAVATVQPTSTQLVAGDKRAGVIELLKDGVPKKHAAQVVGVHEATLYRWIADDAAFASEVRAAESAAVALRVRRIGRAGERDWRADSWFLERTQRDSFGSDNAKGGAVNVQINIERDAKGTEPVRIESID